jgi:hypothetical protein
MSRLAAVALSLVLIASGVGSALAQSDAHSMPGEITRVDGKEGWVHVKTSEGTLIVHFPPSELANVKKGDKITLHLALKDMGPAPEKAPTTPPSKK